jgi:DNA-binding XRE family transcriptional regulator
MSALTKKHLTNDSIFFVSCPTGKETDVKNYLKRMGCHVSDDIDAKKALPDRSPGTLLSGARYREDMTQAQLSKATGIQRRHISEMENGKRTIGKANARRLGKVLGVDYRYFL